MTETTKIFAARNVLTMTPYRPNATHVAVRDGRILGVGGLDELAAWGPYDLDDRFADDVIVPGLVEAHSHALEGAVWKYVYVGFFDRRDPDGRLWKGLSGIEAVIGRLKEEEARKEDPDESLIGWGLDPIYFDGRRMNRHDLDQVSTTRPVIVLHANGHVLNANSETLRRADITAGIDLVGVVKDDAGEPTGELQELAAEFRAFGAAGSNPFFEMCTPDSLWTYAKSAQQTGVTTLSDLFNPLSDDDVVNLGTVTADPDYPVRLVPAYSTMSVVPEEGIARIKSLMGQSTDKLYFGPVKMMTDGSIQGFTARLKWPGYLNGMPNGIWNVPPDDLKKTLFEYHKAGLQIHIHANGDEATEVMIDAIAEAQAQAPRFDHRHTLQHAQMISEAMLARAAALGICVNMFASHVYYWGEEHIATTMGADRAHRLEPFATAQRLGVPYAMHTDAPVTPMGPLFSAWCAVNRTTARGRVLGEPERISAYDALRAITLGAAYTLKMDHLVGSIETGKFADFAVLDDDPLAVPDAEIKDIGVRATVLGGRVFAGAK